MVREEEDDSEDVATSLVDSRIGCKRDVKVTRRRPRCGTFRAIDRERITTTQNMILPFGSILPEEIAALAESCRRDFRKADLRGP